MFRNYSQLPDTIYCLSAHILTSLPSTLLCQPCVPPGSHRRVSGVRTHLQTRLHVGATGARGTWYFPPTHRADLSCPSHPGALPSIASPLTPSSSPPTHLKNTRALLRASILSRHHGTLHHHNRSGPADSPLSIGNPSTVISRPCKSHTEGNASHLGTLQSTGQERVSVSTQPRYRPEDTLISSPSSFISASLVSQ